MRYGAESAVGIRKRRPSLSGDLRPSSPGPASKMKLLRSSIWRIFRGRNEGASSCCADDAGVESKDGVRRDRHDGAVAAEVALVSGPALSWASSPASSPAAVRGVDVARGDGTERDEGGGS